MSEKNHDTHIEVSRDTLRKIGDEDDIEIKSLWSEIRHALEKAADKLDEAEDEILGIKLAVTTKEKQ